MTGGQLVPDPVAALLGGARDQGGPCRTAVKILIFYAFTQL